MYQPKADVAPKTVKHNNRKQKSQTRSDFAMLQTFVVDPVKIGQMIKKRPTRETSRRKLLTTSLSNQDNITPSAG